MMFSSTKVLVTIAAVATTSCAWLASNILCCGSGHDSTLVRAEIAAPAVVYAKAATAERISYNGQTNTHSFHDVADGLYYTYSSDGFSFRPDGRYADHDEWQVQLKLDAVRRADRKLEATAAPVVSVAPTNLRVDVGSYAMDYSRTEEGMRQNFFIREQLPGNEPLAVDIHCNADLDMVLAGEDDLLFVDKNSSQPVACYRDLYVWDAAGRVLESHMEIADNGVRLVVDDANALYPITVDPVVTAFWAATGSQSGEKQGWTVAGGGDVNGDGYKDVVTGSPYYDYAGNTDAGCVRVYLGTASGVSTTASTVIYGGQANASFGWSVAMVGDVNNDGYDDILVSAPLHDFSGATDAGKVFAFFGSSSGISSTPNWTLEGNAAGGKLGYSVAAAGNVDGDSYDDVILGMPGYSNGQTNEGRALVFCGSSSGLGASHSWSAESNQADAVFGTSVASAGDVNGDGYADVAIGAPKYSNGQTEEGRAFVYTGSGTGLGNTAAWTAEANQAVAEFGTSVSSAGDVNGDGYADVVVGAPRYDNGQTNEGKVFLYLGSNSGLNSTEVWSGESDQNNAYMGWAVAAAGDVNNDGYGDFAVGAPYYDNGASADAGRVVVYGGSSTGVPAYSSKADGATSGEMFGYSVSSAGKVNSNNKHDILVGSPNFSGIVNNGGETSLMADLELIYEKAGADALVVGEAQVYPNPSRTGIATVEFNVPEAASAMVQVLDYTGAVLYERDLGVVVGRTTAELPLSTVTTGVYIVRVSVGGQHVNSLLHIVR